MISDVDPESPGHPLPSMSLRSNQIGDLSQLLDEGYTQLDNNPRAKRDHNNKIHQLTPDPNILKDQGFGNIPNRIPSNWVAPEAFTSLTEVERRGIKLQEPVDLSLSIDKLRSMTRHPNVTQSSYMQT
ncbi:hypothetical protein O181_004965 [Austropuccinia psidii MF-1]|uniref:Uncharacterized protein n=1 Tax=Austropuccinia psidii MF-1 TaxID=1389203 RepID=A0A9Q3GFD2_9BASI|nr:hypothetical protein [Austropuccinia psidii MF-1]